MASAERWGFGGKINLAKMKEMHAKTPTIIRRCVRAISHPRLFSVPLFLNMQRGCHTPRASRTDSGGGRRP